MRQKPRDRQWPLKIRALASVLYPLPAAANTKPSAIAVCCERKSIRACTGDLSNAYPPSWRKRLHSRKPDGAAPRCKPLNLHQQRCVAQFARGVPGQPSRHSGVTTLQRHDHSGKALRKANRSDRSASLIFQRGMSVFTSSPSGCRPCSTVVRKSSISYGRWRPFISGMELNAE